MAGRVIPRAGKDDAPALSGSAEALVARIAAGDVRAIARVLTRVEAEDAETEPILDALYRMTGRARVVGITGVPGAGKSTLLGRLAAHMRKSYEKVALLAIDPSSDRSGGALLGDRIRMSALTADPGVFVRSTATRGGRGGLARTTYDAIDVLDAAGYPLIFVETVGVGQAELEVVYATDTTILVSAPGLGDEVQAIKAGILELADIHVVNKSDRPDAQRTALDIQATLAIVSGGRRVCAPVLLTNAETGAGIAAVASAIQDHLRAMDESGEGRSRQRLRTEMRVRRAAEAIAAGRIDAALQASKDELLDDTYRRERSPAATARVLLRRLNF